MSSYGQLKRDAEIYLPVGTILSWTTGTVPDGFFLCDGSAKSRTDYAELFAIISTDYGVGDGSSTFNLPNLVGKQVVYDDSNTTLAGNAGAASATINTNINTGSANIVSNISGATGSTSLTPNQLPSHSHTMFSSTIANIGASELSSANATVAYKNGQAGASPTDFKYTMKASVPSSLAPSRGKTGNAFNAPANTGSGHTHNTGNLAVTSNYGGTINATTNNVSSLLFSSVVLNAIIKF